MQLQSRFLPLQRAGGLAASAVVAALSGLGANASAEPAPVTSPNPVHAHSEFGEVPAQAGEAQGDAAPSETTPSETPRDTRGPETLGGAPASGAPQNSASAALEAEAAALLLRAEEILSGGAEDLGLRVSHARAVPPRGTDERALVTAAKTGWALSLEVDASGAGIELRLAVVARDERVIRVVHRSTDKDSLELAILRLLRDAVRASRPIEPHKPPVTPEQEAPREADGRAYLATTGALVGGYVGYSLEHIAGSSDARLIYPLMTLGAGVGVGASLMAADEWEIRTGEAWYLSATTLWSTAGTLLITDGVGLADSSHRHAYGLLGMAAGLSLGTLAISVTEITQGGAVLTQSGAVFGGLFGALTERLIEADIDRRPTRGLGAGLLSGTLLAGLAATLAPNPSPTRVVYIDLSAFLGGLTGAAAASPVLVGDAVTEFETRVWIGSVAVGTLLGAAAGYVLTRPDDSSPSASPGAASDAPHQGTFTWHPTLYSIPARAPHLPSTPAVGLGGQW